MAHRRLPVLFCSQMKSWRADADGWRAAESRLKYIYIYIYIYMYICIYICVLPTAACLCCFISQIKRWRADADGCI